MKHDRDANRSAPSAPRESQSRRPRYERPVLLDLGELSRGAGAACHAGTAVDCSQGGNAVGLCGSGSNNVGTDPPDNVNLRPYHWPRFRVQR